MGEKLDRRQFLSVAGATGISYAGVLVTGTRSPIAPTRTFEWPSNFNPESNAPIWYPRDLPKPGDLIHEYDVELVITTHEIVPGVECHMFGYNGLVPGPEFRVRLGDWLKINFTNKTYEYHTIHWHGMMLANEMDGVPLGTQWPVGYGQTYQYLFRAQPAGTHYYHCHNMTPLHIQAGMYGPLIVETDDDPVTRQFNYTRDYTMVLSEIDTNYVRDEMNEMLQMFEEMDYLGKNGKMSEMSPLETDIHCDADVRPGL